MQVSQNNTIGLKTFVGEAPQNAVLSGKSAAGKSAYTIDLLTQTDDFYDYTAIIKDGSSCGTKLLGSGNESTVITTELDLG